MSLCELRFVFGGTPFGYLYGERMLGLGCRVGVWLVLTIAQISAATAGIVHFFGIPILLAVPLVGLVAAFASPLAAIAGVYGAVTEWHWHWFFAVCLFFAPLVIAASLMGIAGAVGFGSVLSGKFRNAFQPTSPDKETGHRQYYTATTTDRQRALSDTKVGREPMNWDLPLLLSAIILIVFVVMMLMKFLAPTRGDMSAVPLTSSSGGIGRELPMLQPPVGDREPANTSPESDVLAALEPAQHELSEVRDDAPRLRLSEAPSFDCYKAALAAELLICGDVTLSNLDRQMADLYSRLMLDVASPKALRDDQLEWLAQSRNRCEDLDCLEKVYLKRIATFRNALSVPTADLNGSAGDQSTIAR
jgi:hypothetical protein